MKLMNIKGPKTLPELLHSIKFVKPKLLNSATFTDLKPAFRGHAVYGNRLLASDACTCCRIALRPHVLNLRRHGGRFFANPPQSMSTESSPKCHGGSGVAAGATSQSDRLVDRLSRGGEGNIRQLGVVDDRCDKWT